MKGIGVKMNFNKLFTNFTTRVSAILGRPWVFLVALIFLMTWAFSGPFLGFSDTWQLIVNTTTTIITFLMVFIIQNTQNRDNLAINIKLDALIKKQGIKSKDLLEAEEKTDKKLEQERKVLQRKAKSKTKKRK
jgi:low affinity Fe/Cu permease